MSENIPQELSFEAALSELEMLVGKMENGRLSLDELISGFERGQKLAGFCRSKLDNLERKITLLARDDGNNGQWQDFDAASGEQTSPRAAASAASVQDQDIPF